jgi:ABC transporter substrate binding protein (PQQ-dependent alcohol dehydrogenase system)
MIAFCAVLLPGAQTSRAGQSEPIRILYVEQQIERPPVLSNLTPVPADLGLAGAQLGIADNSTTGKFLGQDFQLDEIVARPGEDIAEIAKYSLASHEFIVVNAPAQRMLSLVDLPAARYKLFFDVSSEDDNLREADCRPNVLHILPSRAMLTDALAQFLVKKNWLHWLLIEGTRDGDKAFSAAVRHSAEKFGATIVDGKVWGNEADIRDTASEEVPLLTQTGEYDVVIVADEAKDFAPSVPYNTWLPRPVAGSVGLTPTAWSEVIEPWGAVQLQNRFRDLAHRGMRDVDFAAWLAVRLIGEAAIRTGKRDAQSLRAYLLSDQLQMSAFKGRGLSFRAWNGQLRQPVHLVTAGTQIAVAPLEGFLHETNELDTLGYDKAETQCTRFTEESTQ